MMEYMSDVQEPVENTASYLYGEPGEFQALTACPIRNHGLADIASCKSS